MKIDFAFEDYFEKFYKRVAELRKLKGVSAREMSLDIGQGESYISQIENRYNLPSLNGFFYICEYLNISPQDFFDDDNKSPAHLDDVIKELKLLSLDELMLIKGVAVAINKNRK